MTQAELEIAVGKSGQKFLSNNRFIMGLVLGKNFGACGKESFVKTCLALDFTTDEIAALLVFIQQP